MKYGPCLSLGVLLLGCGGGGKGGGTAATAQYQSLRAGSEGTFAYAVSADGTVVAGGTDTGTFYPCVWRSSGSASPLLSSITIQMESAVAVSDDGHFFLGEAQRADLSVVPALYAGPDQIVALPSPAGAPSVPGAYPVALSGDGTVALCSDEPQSNPWSPKPYLVKNGVATYLPLPDGVTTAFVAAISGDGTTVVGTVGGKPARWANGGTPEILGTADGSATAVSQDGSVVVGSLVDATVASKPFRWTTATGVQTLPTPSGTTYGTANGVTGDGRTVLLNAHAPSPSVERTVYLWTESQGARSLSDLFVAAGGIASKFTGADATAISTNGKAIVGSGQNASTGVLAGAWKLTLP